MPTKPNYFAGPQFPRDARADPCVGTDDLWNYERTLDCPQPRGTSRVHRNHVEEPLRYRIARADTSPEHEGDTSQPPSAESVAGVFASKPSRTLLGRENRRKSASAPPSPQPCSVIKNHSNLSSLLEILGPSSNSLILRTSCSEVLAQRSQGRPKSGNIWAKNSFLINGSSTAMADARKRLAKHSRPMGCDRSDDDGNRAGSCVGCPVSHAIG